MVRLLFHPISSCIKQPKRFLWGWLNSITNKVDTSRIKDVGPDRAAAEWLLRCGAGVRWKGHNTNLNDYNSLPPGGYRHLFIEEVDATDSCIMSVGFPHLRGLEHLKKLVLHKCYYLDNEALPMLAAVKNSLEELQLSGCGDIDDDGVKSLSCLSNLRQLLLFNLPEVKDKEGCTRFLQSALPNCSVEFQQK